MVSCVTIIYFRMLGKTKKNQKENARSEKEMNVAKRNWHVTRAQAVIIYVTLTKI